MAVLAVNTDFDADLRSTPAQRAYGFHIQTPGTFDLQLVLQPLSMRITARSVNQTMSNDTSHRKWTEARAAYVKDFQCSHKLEPLLKGPFPVLAQTNRSMTLQIHGKAKRFNYKHVLPVLVLPVSFS